MSRKIIVVTSLLTALVAVTFATNDAEARCRARRSRCCNQGYNGGGCNSGCNTGYSGGCNTGYSTGCNTGYGGCAVQNACQPAGGQLMAQPQAEVVSPPPEASNAAPAPAPAPAAPADAPAAPAAPAPAT